MTRNRMRGRIGRSRRIAPLPPGEQQPRDDHNQCDLQYQAKERSKPGHTTKKSVAKQKAEQAGPEETGGKTAKQAAAKQARTWSRLANSVGFPGLRQRALHGRRGARRGLRCRRGREGACPAAPAGKTSARTSMRIGGNKHHGSDRCNRDNEAVSKHRSPPGKWRAGEYG